MKGYADLEHRMQEFMTRQQAQQKVVDSSNMMQFTPPNSQLKPLTDTETSSDDDDLSSGSGLTGSDTSGIDTSSMSQSLKSSLSVKGRQAALPAGTMPKQLNNQYPAMAFNHPKYSGSQR